MLFVYLVEGGNSNNLFVGPYERPPGSLEQCLHLSVSFCCGNALSSVRMKLQLLVLLSVGWVVPVRCKDSNDAELLLKERNEHWCVLWTVLGKTTGRGVICQFGVRGICQALTPSFCPEASNTLFNNIFLFLRLVTACASCCCCSCCGCCLWQWRYRLILGSCTSFFVKIGLLCQSCCRCVYPVHPVCRVRPAVQVPNCNKLPHTPSVTHYSSPAFT